MLNKNNKLKKFISFTLVMAMLICSLFTMSISAVEEIAEVEDANAFVTSIVPVWGENSEFTGVVTMAACTHPQNMLYDFISGHVFVPTNSKDCKYNVGIKCRACGATTSYGSGVGNPCPGHSGYVFE